MRAKLSLLILLGALMLFGFAPVYIGVGQASTPILPFSQVQPGMKGIGKTVVRGTTIEDFFIEVIDVIEGPQLLNSFILIKAAGKAIEESGGIAQGMSGSPVFVDGKLIGAISMAAAWAVPQDALALVTPIESMLELLREGQTLAAPTLSGVIPVRSRSGRIRELRFVTALPSPSELANQAQTLFARKVQNLIFVSGLRARGFALLTAGPNRDDVLVLQHTTELPLPISLEQTSRFRLGNEGLTFLETGVAGSRWQATRDLKPGSALAVLLSKGDVTLTSIGTVTYVEDKKILAFGHPFLFKGPAQYFLTGAFIYTTFRTLQVPFKYGAPDAVVLGTIREDRAQGIAGLLGAEPDQVALKIRVRDRDRRSEKSFSIDVVEMADLLPSLVLSTTTNALDLALNRVSGGTVKAFYTVRLVKDGTPLSVIRRDLFFEWKDIALAPGLQLAQIIANLALNPFQRVDLKEIIVDLEFTEEPKVAEIVGLETDKEMYKPGEAVRFKVVLQPFRGPVFTQEGTFTLPEDLKEDTLTLRATGGREEERRSVTSIEELVKAISESKSNGHITIEAGSAAAQLQLDWFVKGRASKKLKIQRG